MTTNSDWQLHQLYMEVGDAQARREHRHEAADAYALALYYARRMGDADRVQECRRLVVECSPNHVAGQPISAPLFFAQLLMRYPAEVVQETLAQLRAEDGAPDREPSGAHPNAIATAMLEPEMQPRRSPLPDLVLPRVPVPAVSKPPYPGLEGAAATSTPAKKPAFGAPVDDPELAGAGFPAFEHHHVFDLGTSATAQRMQSMRISEDFLLKDAGLPDDEPERRPSLSVGGFLNFVAFLTIVFGLAFAGYASYELYPVLWNMNVDRMVRHSSGESHAGPMLAHEAETGTKEVIEIQPLTGKAGANQPASVTPPPPATLASKPGDEGPTFRQYMPEEQSPAPPARDQLTKRNSNGSVTK